MEAFPMAQAFNSLHQAPERFQQVSRSAICILARLAAKRAVTEQLRAQGVRVTLVKPAEIAAQANAYLAANPQLYDEARVRAQRLGMHEKPKRRKSAVLVTPMPPCDHNR
jgi:hypothetical protein